MKVRGAYIAKYPLNSTGTDLDEVILVQDNYWSETLDQEWDRLSAIRQANEPMLQGWYYDDYQTALMASTNQPFHLD